MVRGKYMLNGFGISTLLISIVLAAIVHSHGALARAEADRAAIVTFGAVLSDICGDIGADHGSAGTHCTLCVASTPLLPAGPDWRRAAGQVSERLSRPLRASAPGIPSIQVLPPARAPPVICSI
jgi:hypothetical protein